VHGPAGIAIAIGVMILAALLCGIVGVLIERLAYRRLRNSPRLAPLITAIGVSFILENIMQIWKGPSPVPFPQFLPNTSYVLAGISFDAREVLVVTVSVVFMVALRIFIFNTKLGKAMRATAQDRDAAQLMGININSTIAWTFFIGSALAGLGDMDEARFALGASLGAGRARDAGYEVAMTLQALSELCPRDDSWEAWRDEADAMFRELGVERLDYTKGVGVRLEAFGELSGHELLDALEEAGRDLRPGDRHPNGLERLPRIAEARLADDLGMHQCRHMAKRGRFPKVVEFVQRHGGHGPPPSSGRAVAVRSIGHTLNIARTNIFAHNTANLYWPLPPGD